MTLSQCGLTWQPYFKVVKSLPLPPPNLCTWIPLPLLYFSSSLYSFLLIYYFTISFSVSSASYARAGSFVLATDIFPAPGTAPGTAQGLCKHLLEKWKHLERKRMPERSKLFWHSFSKAHSELLGEEKAGSRCGWRGGTGRGESREARVEAPAVISGKVAAWCCEGGYGVLCLTRAGWADINITDIWKVHCLWRALQRNFWRYINFLF